MPADVRQTEVLAIHIEIPGVGDWRLTVPAGARLSVAQALREAANRLEKHRG